MKKLSLSFLLVLVLVLFTFSGQAQAWTVPTFDVQGVTENEKVTIVTANFPANYDFVVRMGLFGTKGVDGILISTVDSGAGGTLKFTFPIPAELYQESMIAIRLESTVGGYYAYNWFNNTTSGTHTGGVPIGEIATSPALTTVSVKAGEYVLMKGENLPANEDFNILMGEYGSKGVNGVLADTANSGTDGEFIKSIVIPESLNSEIKIAIRFESQDSALVLYTYFENQTGASGGTGGVTEVYTGIPTISILSIKEDVDVTVQTHNFPANRDFNVLMGLIGTRGVGGIHVTSINSADGGTFTATFDIPDGLKGDTQIAIRLQTADNYFYAYNWFYNHPAATTTTTGSTTTGTTSSSYTGIPTFSITSVVAGDRVTIKTDNLPAGYDFKVLMGKMWTQGIGGTYVTTISSGTGGTLIKEFDIPAELAGNSQIAIRLESTVGGFYAYNWFYNNTTP